MILLSSLTLNFCASLWAWEEPRKQPQLSAVLLLRVQAAPGNSSCFLLLVLVSFLQQVLELQVERLIPDNVHPQWAVGPAGWGSSPARGAVQSDLQPVTQLLWRQHLGAFDRWIRAFLALF